MKDACKKFCCSVTAGEDCTISGRYMGGGAVEQDEKRGLWYMKMAAVGGCMMSRHNLGIFENKERCNLNRALRHWMIAAEAGLDESLQNIGYLFRVGLASKADYEKALRAHQKASDETKSDQRCEAADAAALFKQGLNPLLLAHQKAANEAKSEQRDEAGGFGCCPIGQSLLCK